jgi:hypothetical protein
MSSLLNVKNRKSVRLRVEGIIYFLLYQITIIKLGWYKLAVGLADVLIVTA